MNNRHDRSKRVWLVLDTQLAAGLGYAFSKHDNGVVVCDGQDGHIHISASASAWLSDTQRVSTTELLDDAIKLAKIGHDDSHPPHRNGVPERALMPGNALCHRRVCLRRCLRFQRLTIIRLPPTPSQLELPEYEGPPSWSPADVSPPPKRIRVGGSPPEPILTLLHPASVTSSASTNVEPLFAPDGVQIDQHRSASTGP